MPRGPSQDAGSVLVQELLPQQGAALWGPDHARPWDGAREGAQLCLPRKGPRCECGAWGVWEFKRAAEGGLASSGQDPGTGERRS